jgi:GntR family transcriptional regulator
MTIIIHANAPEPVYEQIVRQIHQAVKSGALKTDTPLPTVRQLAGDLVVNRNTVARAYRMLEEQGVILTAGRKGTFIRRDAAREVAKVKTTRAQLVLRRVVRTLIGDGLSRKEIADIFSAVLSVEARRGQP